MATRFPTAQERKKRETLLELLEAGMVMVYVDPSAPDVDLPAHLHEQDVVALNLSRKFGLEVFRVGPLAIEASLSFGGTRYHCVMPYQAILGCLSHEDGQRIVFEDLLNGGVRTRTRRAPSPETVAPGSRAPRADQSTSSGDTRPRRPTLRLLD